MASPCVPAHDPQSAVPRLDVRAAPAGVTKWSAVVDVAKSVGIDPETICAVGDDTNDIPMLRCARFGVAMGNASIDVQAAANWVAPSHDEDGVADLVDRILRD